MTEPNEIQFSNAAGSKEMLRLNSEGFHYNGQVIKDAGEAYRLFREWLDVASVDAKPRQWQGLTEEELRDAYIAVSGNEWCLGGISNAETFYEAIEAKLREKNA